MTRRTILAVGLAIGVGVALSPVPAAVGFSGDVEGESLIRAVAIWALLNVALGALLLWHRPSLRYAWLMVLAGLFAVGLVWASLHAGDPNGLFFVASAFPAVMAQVFPTGRRLPGRWGWFTYAVPTGLLGLFVTSAVWGDVPIGAVWALLWVVGLLATLPLVVLRYLRAGGVERAQLKWFLFAVGAGVGAYLSSSFINERAARIGAWAVAVALSLPVLAIALALLRYRLYDIDRVISRTVSYATVTVILFAFYSAVVGAATAVLPPGSSTLAVAGATLAAAGLMRPILTRVQRVVDRRFNRARYDAGGIADAFSGRLRDRVDPEVTAADLLSTVRLAVEPSTATLWMKSAQFRESFS